MPFICEHEPALYSWDSDGANSINAFSDRLWFVKCKQCCKRSNLAVDPNLAELYWNSDELVCDASDIFSSAIFHQMLPLTGCDHQQHAYVETPIGWMAYCTKCNNVHTPIVTSCEKAERLWHSKLYLMLDEDNAKEYLKLKNVFSIIRNHVSYIKTFWGLLKKKSRRTHSTEIGMDITRRIRALYKICCGAKLDDDLGGHYYDSITDHIEVDIIKIESDKLEV